MAGPDLAEPLACRLPPGVAGYVGELLGRQPVEVRLARPRRTKLGDHRPPARHLPVHRISVNDNLNPYAFLTTLLHEIAHATAWERHRGRRRLRPHGPEWQAEFGGILGPVVGQGILPAVVEAALARSLSGAAAATCSDRGLVLALAEFDLPPAGYVRVEDLAERAVFRAPNGAVFRAGRRLRTRRQCFELRTGREYRVHGLALVEPLPAAAKPAAGRRRR
jgi:SprT protein